MKVQLLSTHPHATGASWVQFSSPQNLSGASNIQNLKAMTHQADGQILTDSWGHQWTSMVVVCAVCLTPTEHVELAPARRWDKPLWLAVRVCRWTDGTVEKQKKKGQAH